MIAIGSITDVLVKQLWVSFETLGSSFALYFWNEALTKIPKIVWFLPIFEVKCQDELGVKTDLI